jgi:hypothetical protein
VAGENLESLPAHDIRKKSRLSDHRPAGSSPPDLARCTLDLARSPPDPARGHCSGPFLDRVKNRRNPPKIRDSRAAAHVLACGSMGHVSLKYSCEKRYECFT